jgi:hypothetical protein
VCFESVSQKYTYDYFFSPADIVGGDVLKLRRMDATVVRSLIYSHSFRVDSCLFSIYFTKSLELLGPSPPLQLLADSATTTASS